MGLGDKLKGALEALGITEQRVESWVGTGCGCQRRREWLNKWGDRVLETLGKKQAASDPGQPAPRDPQPANAATQPANAPTESAELPRPAATGPRPVDAEAELEKLKQELKQRVPGS
jgi:hypothetical protein